MNTLDRLLEIASRLDHIDNGAEWIAKEAANTDSGVSHTGTMICAVVDDVREKIYALVQDLEDIAEIDCYH